MLSFFFALMFALMATSLGWLVTEKLRIKDCFSNIERIAVSYTLGCFLVYLGVFSIAPFRLDLTSISILLIILLFFAVFGLKLMSLQACYRLVCLEFEKIKTDKWLGILWATLIFISCSSILQGLAPPNDYDGLGYHLAFPRLDVESGRAVLAFKTGWAASFYPALGGHLTRVALIIADAESAQIIHGLFGLVGAIATSSLAIRMGLGQSIALLSAIMFLSIRFVVWQMGTVETDIPVSSLATLALVVYITTRENNSVNLEVVFGLIVACAILMKYHGLVTTFALSTIILYDLALRRKTLKMALVGPLMAGIAIAPHAVRNFVLSGNPVFPILNEIFNPEMPKFYQKLPGLFGTGRDFSDLVTAPWNIFIFPTHFFDGMVIGGPYLLALFPLAFLNKGLMRYWRPLLFYIFIYYLIWFWFLSQQVRFLGPVMPILCVFAAFGVAQYWREIRFSRKWRLTFNVLMTCLALNQAMFVGIFSLIRLPVALGIITPHEYHTKTPSMDGAYYSTCKFIEANLRPGERYFLIAPFISFYCPQRAASLIYFPDEEGWWLKSEKPPRMPISEFINRLNDMKFRYFLVQVTTSSRRSIGSRPTVKKIDLSQIRFGKALESAFNALQPLASDRYSAVFDGGEVLKFLKAKYRLN